MNMHDGWQRVQHGLALSAVVLRERGDSVEEAERLLVLLMVMNLVFSSSTDLSALRYISVKKLDRHLNSLLTQEMIGSFEAGINRQDGTLYYIRHMGMEYLRQNRDVPWTWQCTDRALQTLHGALPMVGAINFWVPRLFASEAVETPATISLAPRLQPFNVEIGKDTRLVRLVWVRKLRDDGEGNRGDGGRRVVDVLAQYRTGAGHTFWIAIAWVGDVVDPNYQSIDSLADAYRGFDTQPNLLYREPASPAGMIFVVQDRLAAFQVTRELNGYVACAIVTASKEVIEPLQPMSPIGFLHQPFDEVDTLPKNETFPEWLSQPGRNEIFTGARHETFRYVSLYPGISPSSLARNTRQPRDQCRSKINAFKDALLAVELKEVRIKLKEEGKEVRRVRAELDVDSRRIRWEVPVPGEKFEAGRFTCRWIWTPMRRGSGTRHTQMARARP